MSGKYLCESVELGCQLNRFLPRNKVLEVCNEDILGPNSPVDVSRVRIRHFSLPNREDEVIYMQQ